MKYMFINISVKSFEGYYLVSAVLTCVIRAQGNWVLGDLDMAISILWYL